VADVENPATLARALAAVQQTISEFDLACSSFRGDSELAAVNAGAGRPVKVGNLLFEAVAVALHAARVTDGAVDPTVGQALIAHGFSPGTPGDSARRGFAFVRGHRAVRLDDEGRSILIPPGVTLDLGATAKALAADRAAAAAADAADCGVLVSLGGDIATAAQPPAGGWPIRVTDDHRADLSAPGQTVSLTGGCLATSSTTVRRGADGSHHLIDPETGMPAREVVRTASVVASTCLEANTVSTAAIVRGARGVGWLDSIGLPIRLVLADGRVKRLGGWPTEGEDLPVVDDFEPGGGPLAGGGNEAA
jgi:thiamine biosynthesis lipoprotein